MKIYFVIFLIISFAFGCKSHVSDNFDNIDFSLYGNSLIKYGIKIKKDGTTYLSIENNRIQTKTNYVFKLDPNEIDTISSLVKNILVNRYDSIYEFGCDQCLTYCLMINTKHQKFKVSLLGYLFADSITKPIDQFAFHMRKLVKKYQINIDSACNFESKKYLILPPPPPPPAQIANDKIKNKFKNNN